MNDPGVEENVFRELDIPAAVSSSDDEEGDGDIDDRGGVDEMWGVGNGSEDSASADDDVDRDDGRRGADAHRVWRERNDERRENHDNSRVAAYPVASALRRDGASAGAASSLEGSAPGQASVGTDAGERGGRGERRLLSALRDTRPTRVTNADLLRKFRMSRVPSAGAATTAARLAEEVSRDEPERAGFPSSEAAARASPVTKTTAATAGLGFEIYRDDVAPAETKNAFCEDGDGDVKDDGRAGSMAVSSSTAGWSAPSAPMGGALSGLGFAVYRDGDDDDEDQERGSSGGHDYGDNAYGRECEPKDSVGHDSNASSGVAQQRPLANNGGLPFAVFRDEPARDMAKSKRPRDDEEDRVTLPERRNNGEGLATVSDADGLGTGAHTGVSGDVKGSAPKDQSLTGRSISAAAAAVPGPRLELSFFEDDIGGVDGGGADGLSGSEGLSSLNFFDDSPVCCFCHPLQICLTDSRIPLSSNGTK